MNVFNGERYLPEALASVCAQTLSDWELLIVDDGSTDRTVAIAEEWAGRDERMRVVRLPHAGAVQARNRALELARAPLAALWDQDDLASPERLGLQLDFLARNPDVGVLGTWAWHIGESGRRVGVSEFGPLTREAFRALQAAGEPMFAVASSVVFSVEAARAAGGFSVEMAEATDVDLWTRMADHTVMLILPRRLVEYRIHAASASTRRFFRQMEALELIKVNARRRRASRPQLTLAQWREAVAARPRAERLRRARVWRSRLYYRTGAGLLAAGRPSGVAYLAAAAALDPATVAARLRRQVGPIAEAFVRRCGRGTISAPPMRPQAPVRPRSPGSSSERRRRRTRAR